jgi:hypothetical protein
MENKEPANDDAKKLTLVVVFMLMFVVVLFGIVPLV